MSSILKLPEFKSDDIVRRGVAGLFVFVICMGLWVSIVPSEGAVTAEAYVRAEMANKPVQHLRGGRIKEVHVTAGQKVEAGAALVTLFTHEEEASLNAVQSQKLELLINRDLGGSLLADFDNVVFEPDTLALADELNKAMTLERAVAAFRQTEEILTQELQLLASRQLQLDASIDSSRAQLETTQREKKLVDEKLDSLRKLLERHLVAEIAVDEVEQTSIRLAGTETAQRLLIEEKMRSMSQLQVESKLLLQRSKKSASELRDAALSELPQTVSQIERLENRISSATLRSGHDGTITQLVVHSVGTTVGPGEILMTILPDRENLVVEARLAPADIEQVYPGQQARLRLRAFNSRTAAILTGQVTAVSADRQHDNDGYYYQVEIEPSQEDLSSHENLYLGAGMPVDAFLITKPRTILEYLLEPISHGLYHSMRES